MILIQCYSTLKTKVKLNTTPVKCFYFFLVIHICLFFIWIYSLGSIENAEEGKKIEVKTMIVNTTFYNRNNIMLIYYF